MKKLTLLAVCAALTLTQLTQPVHTPSVKDTFEPSINTVFLEFCAPEIALAATTGAITAYNSSEKTNNLTPLTVGALTSGALCTVTLVRLAKQIIEKEDLLGFMGFPLAVPAMAARFLAQNAAAYAAGYGAGYLARMFKQNNA